MGVGAGAAALLFIYLAVHNAQQVNRISRIITSSEKVATNEYCDIYFNDDKDKVIYICGDELYDDARFYLHLYPLAGSQVLGDDRKQYGYDNLDFSASDYKIKILSPKYRGETVIIRDIPGYGIDLLNTGQYRGAEVLWTSSAQLTSTADRLDKIAMSDLTDVNWSNGRYRGDGRVILFPYTRQNELSLLQAKQLNFNGEAYNVIQVSVDPGIWIRATLDRNKKQGANIAVLRYEKTESASSVGKS